MDTLHQPRRRMVVILLVVVTVATAVLSRNRGCIPCAAVFCELPATVATAGN